MSSMFSPTEKRLSVQPTTNGWDASLTPQTPSQSLFDLEKLGIPPQDREMFIAVNKAVRDYMSGPQFDPSHNYEHIQRVITIAHHIYTTELACASSSPDAWILKVDPLVVYVGAMMHDVGEPKYVLEGQLQAEHIENMLRKCNVPTPLARRVEYLVPLVSFSRESQDPQRSQTECNDYPELRIIQDADRIDSIGAVGQGRCFLFQSSAVERRTLSIHRAVQMHRTRFELVVGFMKTDTGRKEAEKRWKRMQRFLEEWNEETDVSAVI